MSFIQINQLSKIYDGGADQITALDHIDLSVDEGTFLGVMGQSGSGKSTFLTILGGLCHPTTGQVLVDDIDVYALSSELRADFRREFIGFVFQSFNLIPYLTAEENVMLPLTVKKISLKEKRSMASIVLDRVGLSHRVKHLPNQLSGGEQERVAIARALVNAPPLILADEPTGSLDSTTSQEIMDLFADLNRGGQTIVMVTHNDEIRSYFNRTLLLCDGAVAEDRSQALEELAQVG
jgi:putative ABC transport system ATP-binding protein